ncbi:MAG: leucine-rich repeat protein [Ruminococcus sp.]|nr:leucine-rich repeat protein [Ruminococcus sp.]
MIKRVIAGALSAVMCTSAASVGASAHGLSGVLPTPSVAAAADEPVSTAAVTTSETTSATTTSATTTSAATTTAAASEPTLTVELGESITASVSEGGTVIISGSGEMNSFKSSPFENLKIKRVIIGDGITSIGSAVFRGCDELAAFGTADVPDGVSELPDSIKTVGSSAFEGCKAIKELRLGSGAEKLGSYAFANCTGLTSLTVPACVTTMERCVFSGCTELTELTLPYAATDASCAAADGDVSPDNSVADLFYDEHWNWDNPSFDSSAYKLTKITVTGGKKVPQYAFANMKCLKEVDLSGTEITSIDKNAFSECTSLADAKLPASLKNIGENAFLDCAAVSEFALPAGLETIGWSAFGNCTGISTLTVPDSVTSMGRTMLTGCTELTELTLPFAATDSACALADGNTNPDHSVTDLFYDEHWNWENASFDSSAYKLAKITVTGGEKVPQYAFANMKCLKEVDLSAAKTVLIDSHAFYRCSSLTDVRLPETLTALGDYSFSETPITALPDNGHIISLGNGVFAGCQSLEVTTFPASYENIGTHTFSGCKGIKTFTVPENVKTLGRMSFTGCTELTELTLTYAATDSSCTEENGSSTPDNSVTDLFYDEHWNWENASFDSKPYKLTKITVVGGEKIPQYAFSDFASLTEVDLSKSNITCIEQYAFNNCTSLEEVKLPASLVTIGAGAFRNCTAVKEFTLPQELKTISEYAFKGCTGISSLVIPDSVTSMGRMMLEDCFALETLQLPYAATNVNAAAADGDTTPDCSVADLFIDQHWNWENSEMDFSRYGISKIVITGGARIPQYAFSNMRTLREVELSGADIRTIDPYAFSGCVGLTSAEIPETVAEIKPNAFAVTNADVFVYGKETVLADKSLTDGYAGTIFGYNESSAKTYADENEYSFSPLDGKAVISPSFVSMAVGDTHRIRTGAAGVTFSTSAPEIASVDKNGTVTAISAGRAVIEALTADGTSYTVDIEVRPRVSLYTLGDVNDDGKIDAKDASAILVEYSEMSTGGASTFTEARKKAADVNSDSKTDAKDASAILSYYALASTAEGDIPTLEEYLAPEEQAD